MNKIVALSVIFLFACTVSAQNTSYWEILKAPCGGAPSEMLQASNGKVYALFYDSTAYCSDDNGVNWYRIFEPSADLQNGLQRITAGRGGTLFSVKLVSPSATPLFDVYRSDNNGLTWQKFLPDSDIESIAQIGDGTLFAYRKRKVTNGHIPEIIRSADQGKTWSVVYDQFTEDQRYTLTVDQYDNLVLGDIFGNLFYYSSNKGLKWAKAFFSSEVNNYTISNGNLYVTGLFSGYRLARWNPVTQKEELLSTPLSQVEEPGLFVFPDHKIWLRSNTKLFESTDNAQTWTLLPDPVVPNYFPMRGTMSGGTIMAQTGGDLVRSSDNGKTWHFSTYGINHAVPIDMVPISNHNWVALTGSGIWETTNAGENWHLKKEIILSGYSTQYGKLIKATDNTFLAKINSLVFKYDRVTGATTEVSPIGGATPDLWHGGLGINDQTKSIYLPTNAGTARSKDMGDTWQTVLSAYPLKKMQTHPSGRIFALVDTTYKSGNAVLKKTYLFSSADDGDTWKKTHPGLEIKDFAVTNNGTVYAIQGDKLIKSTDEGVSWATRNGNLPCDDFFANEAGQLFVVYSNEIRFSNDEGNTWQLLPAPKDLVTNAYHLLSSDPQNHLYVPVWQYAYTSNIGHLMRSRRSTAEGCYLMGQISLDADAECSTLDPGAGLPAWSVKASGTDEWYAFTDSTGHYRMFLDTGAYVLTTRPYTQTLWEPCTDSLPILLPNLHDTLHKNLIIKAVADCPYMTVDVSIPKLKHCFDNNVYVSWRNIGTMTADSAWVDILLDPVLIFVDTQSVFPYTNLGGNRFRFHIGSVGVGYGGALHFRVNVNCATASPGEALCVEAHIYPDVLCIENPNWSGAQVVASARCEQDTAVVFEIKNVGTAPTGLLEYFIIEDDVVIMGGKDSYEPGQSKSYMVPANGQLNRIEVEQAPGHPFSRQAAAWVEGCGNKTQNSLVNLYFLNDGIPTQDIACTEVVSSFDPNDKQGFPLGYGPQHQIRPGQELEYLIRFQNTGTDTAYVVVLRDTLDQWLDPSTVYPVAASHPYKWHISGEGALRFDFNNIMLPDSSTNEEGSQGFISFRVHPKTNVPSGSKIRNQASIYFDFNAPVLTNMTLHTVGIDMVSKVRTPKDKSTSLLEVAPNPFFDKTTFTLRDGNFENHRLMLTDLLGRPILQAQISGYQYVFEGKGLVPGLYTYHLEDSTGRLVGYGKLLMNEAE